MLVVYLFATAEITDSDMLICVAIFIYIWYILSSLMM